MNDLFYLNLLPTVSYCDAYLKFNKRCAVYLYNLYLNNDNELSGVLTAYLSSSLGKKLWTVDCGDHSIKGKGNDKEVESVDGMITFHTHPEYTYGSLDIEVGWPSKEDYEALSELFFEDDNTILHCNIAREGIYMISLSELGIQQYKNRRELKKNIKSEVKKDVHKRISRYFNKDNSINDIPNYLRAINGSIFDVALMSWSSIFKGSYYYFKFRNGKNCKINNI